jgi:hypothetical protein
MKDRLRVDEAHLAKAADDETSSWRGTTTARQLRQGRARAKSDCTDRVGRVGAAQASHAGSPRWPWASALDGRERVERRPVDQFL